MRAWNGCQFVGENPQAATSLQWDGPAVLLLLMLASWGEPPSIWWTPLLSCDMEQRVSDDENASEFHGRVQAGAVALLQASGRPLTQIAIEWGIQPSMLRTWRNAVLRMHAEVSQRRSTQAVAPQAGTPGHRSAKMARPRRDARRLRMGRDILQKQQPPFSRRHRNEVPLQRGSSRRLAGAPNARCPGDLAQRLLHLAWLPGKSQGGGESDTAGRYPACPCQVTVAVVAVIGGAIFPKGAE